MRCYSPLLENFRVIGCLQRGGSLLLSTIVFHCIQCSTFQVITTPCDSLSVLLSLRCVHVLICASAAPSFGSIGRRASFANVQKTHVCAINHPRAMDPNDCATAIIIYPNTNNHHTDNIINGQEELSNSDHDNPAISICI